ncbi:hypothetical protein [Staphylococcus chromogenes]|uniref:hypothetical protein n=1 Tax=Staphylococcus chromogenes TaxID=46126 RepID=UPI002885F65B|nr:hypothetical protein [Staphylococcus chromogenes]MDT0672842.1 hypothetical protein [Staphylococcus chromogenes]
MTAIISILIVLLVTALIMLSLVLAVMLEERLLNWETMRKRFKRKSRTERKVQKEIKRIESEIEERKRLEHLYEKRDELIRKMEGWYE